MLFIGARGGWYSKTDIYFGKEEKKQFPCTGFTLKYFYQREHIYLCGDLVYANFRPIQHIFEGKKIM